MRRLPLLLLLPTLLVPPLAARAVSSPSEMLPDPVEEHRAELIGRQLRCLVCQNEDIEDSGADLARDLRHIVRVQVAEGRTNRQIMQWMVARYGNFVRLSPPFDAETVLLWSMPVLAVAAGLGLAAWSLGRDRTRPPPTPLTADERRRLARLAGAEES